MATRGKGLITMFVKSMKFNFQFKSKIVNFFGSWLRNPSFGVKSFSEFSKQFGPFEFCSEERHTFIKNVIQTFTMSMPIEACFRTFGSSFFRSILTSKMLYNPIKHWFVGIYNSKFSCKIISLTSFVIFSKLKNGKASFSVNDTGHISKNKIGVFFHILKDTIKNINRLAATTERGGCESISDSLYLRETVRGIPEEVTPPKVKAWVIRFI